MAPTGIPDDLYAELIEQFQRLEIDARLDIAGRGKLDYESKLKAMAEAMGLEKGRHAAAGIAEMNERLGLPVNMKKYGYKVANLDELVDDAHKSWFNNTAPYHHTREEYREIIEEVLG